MDVKQIYTIVNNATKEFLGEQTVLQEDLSNIVDIGNEIFNADAVDAYVKSLVNHIGRVIFVNRPYAGSAPSVMMDAWEYGSVMEKITCDTPEATENKSWDLRDGQSYDVNVFHKPSVSAKFYNNRVTFEVPMSFTSMQVKQSFSNAEQLNSFLSMIETAIENSMTIKLDSLVMRTINNMTATTIWDSFASGDETPALPSTLSSVSGIRCVNLLKLYKDNGGTSSLTPAKAIKDKEFIRFAAYMLSLYSQRMTKISKLFNGGGKDRFTAPDRQHMILLSEFKTGADIFLQSDTFHNQYTALSGCETVPFWQGSGTGYDFAETSKINVKTSDGHAVAQSGILGVLFDRYALGVSNLNRRVTSNYNAKAEFYNNYYKMDAGYFNDANENFVVFFIA